MGIHVRAASRRGDDRIPARCRTNQRLLEQPRQPGQNHTLRADGIEQPHPTDAGQTIKNIDRLVVGKYTILFTALARWLVEMADAVDVIR